MIVNMKKLLIALISTSFLLANDRLMIPSLQDSQKVAVQNAILAKVNGNTISMIDVKKKMDIMFHQNYPQFIESSQARLQFYEMSWKHVLMDLIDHELMVADAEEKEIKLTDSEIRETMENRFGPNIMQTLDKIGLSFDEAWKLTRNEMIVQRMSWWFIHAQAQASVTPQEIKKAYKLYLEKNPPYTEWKYRVVSIRVNNTDDEAANQVHDFLVRSKKDPASLESELKSFNTSTATVSVSGEFHAKTHELSEAHKTALANLQPHAYSKPAFQINRVDKKGVYRIFYLVDSKEHPAPSFEVIAPQLRAELTQKAVTRKSDEYLGKLRKKYGFTADAENAIPKDLHPFSIQ
jgi:hypothetical protein